MVYKRPDYNPQPDDGHHHGKGWNPGEPSWGEPHSPFENENEYSAPKRSPQKPKPPAAPKSKQLNVFEANGIAFSQFDTSLYGRQSQQGSSGWMQPEKPQPRYGKQLNWFAQNNFGFNNLDPALLPRRQVQYSHHRIADLLDAPLKSSEQEEPRSRRRRAPKSGPLDMDDLRRELPKRQLSVDGNTTEPKPGRRSWAEQQPRTPWDFSGLGAITDYMGAHPEDTRKPGNSFDGLLGKTQAFKEKEAQAAAQAGIRSGFPVDGVQVAATELTPGMLTPPQGEDKGKASSPNLLAQSFVVPHSPDVQQQVLTRKPMQSATDLEAAAIQQHYKFTGSDFARWAVGQRQHDESIWNAWIAEFRRLGDRGPEDRMDAAYKVGYDGETHPGTFRSTTPLAEPHRNDQGRFFYNTTLSFEADAYYRDRLPGWQQEWMKMVEVDRQKQLAAQQRQAQQRAAEEQARQQGQREAEQWVAQQQTQQKALQQVQGRSPQSTPQTQGGPMLDPIPFGKTGLTVPIPTQGQTSADPVSVKTPVTEFQRELVDTATQRLQANKVRLNTQQKTYAKDLSPNSPRWSELRQLSQQDQILAHRQQQLNQQAAALQDKHRPGANLAPGDTRAEFLNDMEVKDPTVRVQIDELNAQIRVLQQSRDAMKAQVPALAVIDTAKVAHAPNTQQNNAAIFKDISKGFGDINHGIDTLQGQIAQDPNKALVLDDVKAATLHKMGIDPKQKNHTPQQQAVIDYLGKEEFKDNLIKWGGLAGAGALTVGAIIGAVLAPLSVIPAWLMGGATVLSAGTATYDVLQLITIDQGAQAGQAGGQKLTSVDPETARFNLTMGYGNLALSALDVGLTAKEAIALGKLPVMRGLAGSLSAEKLTDLMRGIKAGAQGHMSEALTAIRKLKGKISPEVEAELMQTMRSAGSGGNVAHMADGSKVERSSLFDHVTGRLKGLGDRLGVDKMVDWIDRQVDGLLHPMQGPQRDIVPVEGPMGKSAEKTAEENVKDAKALQTRTQARGSKKPHVVEQYANTGAVKPFIGTKVDPNHLPEGYLYGKIPTGKDALGREIYREVVYMPVPGKKTVPLVVENGRIALGKEGEYRIVEKAVYDANVVTKPGKAGKLLGGKSQIHHMFADNMLRNTPFGQRALRLGAVNPDGSINLIELASSKGNLAEARKAYPDVKFSDFIHNTNHKEFDGLMQTVVDQQIDVIREARGFSGNNEQFIPQMTKAEIQTVWNKSLARMKRGLMGEDKKLYNRIKTRPHSGSLAQGESQDSSEVA